MPMMAGNNMNMNNNMPADGGNANPIQPAAANNNMNAANQPNAGN